VTNWCWVTDCWTVTFMLLMSAMLRVVRTTLVERSRVGVEKEVPRLIGVCRCHQHAATRCEGPIRTGVAILAP
jgi:hypothetical protein